MIGDSDESSIGQFKRVLRTLQNSNVNIPEMRELREEQEYLEKLRDQRARIEGLKGKFDEKDVNIRKLQSQNNALRKQLEQLGRKFQKLEIRITEEQDNAKKAESGYLLLESERDRLKTKMNEIEAQREQFRRLSKTRETTFMNIEDDYKRKMKELKDTFMNEKKKLIESYESKIVSIESYKSKAEDAERMQDLIDRQNRALKLQEQSLVELSNRNQQAQSQLEEIRLIYEKTILCKDELSGQADFYKQEAERLARKLKEFQDEQSQRREVELIKGRMNQMRRGEIERIEEIFNELN